MEKEWKIDPEVKCIMIEDNVSYPADLFSLQKAYRPYISSVMVPQGIISDRIHRMAESVYEFYKDLDNLTFLIILNGADEFFSELFRCLKELVIQSGGPIMTMEYAKLTSYVGTESAKEIKVPELREEMIRERNVLIVEDLIDSGNTLNTIIQYVKGMGPCTLKTALLILKRNPLNLEYDITPDWLGFCIPNKFVVGYYMDYNQIFRDLGHLCIINAHGRDNFKIGAKGIV